MPANCPEIRILPRLVAMIWRFPARLQGLLLDEAHAQPERYRVLRCSGDVRRLLQELTAAHPECTHG